MRIEVPTLEMEASWSLDELMAYFGSWSSVARYRMAHGVDPRDRIAEPLAAAWGPVARRRIVWPLGILAGTLPGGQ